jgi:endoglucanase
MKLPCHSSKTAMSMDRRTFLLTSAAFTVASMAGAAAKAAEKASPVSLPDPLPSHLPLWRGFNLLEKFISQGFGKDPAYRETDFQMMEDWGFDFARLPISYHSWSRPDPAEWLKMDEGQLAHLDQAVEFGTKHKVHINLNLHRIPGYCVNPPAEPLDLWKDEKAQAAAAHQWATLAKRFKGIPNTQLSFDLLNEPPDIPEETYTRVMKTIIAAIRAEDKGRLIIVDGIRWGRDPVFSLADAGIAQSTRGYDPMRISHHKANWVKGSEKWPEPSWPLKEGEQEWNKDRLRRERIESWKKLEAKGVGVHVGEWGAHNNTPHKAALAWMRDQLSLWREAGWGWALWNLRGSFGILDSGRKDVDYEDYKGHKLDREMLKVLLAG